MLNYQKLLSRFTDRAMIMLIFVSIQARRPRNFYGLLTVDIVDTSASKLVIILLPMIICYIIDAS